MFTGIIKSIGRVSKVSPVPGGKRLSVEAGDWAAECQLGDSLCVSGVCLTVTAISPPTVGFDVISETLQRSILGEKRVGDRVNLERAMMIGDRFDGHFVQGHVDGRAEVTEVIKSEREHAIWFRPDSNLRPYVVPKGSIAIDGVSLTIAEVRGDAFSTALIPTTLERTTLGLLSVADRVNVESDVIARTVVHHLSAVTEAGGLDLKRLKQAGFV